jgi:hypothetical protein
MNIAIDSSLNFVPCLRIELGNGHHSLILMTDHLILDIIKIVKLVLRADAKYVEIQKDALMKSQDGIQRDVKTTVAVGVPGDTWTKKDTTAMYA